jgi:hypothetical protein
MRMKSDPLGRRDQPGFVGIEPPYPWESLEEWRTRLFLGVDKA